MASFGPDLRSHDFENLTVAQRCLRFQNRCGLGLNQNLPFPDHYYLKEKPYKSYPKNR
jgi:hypothetical protein